MSAVFLVALAVGGCGTQEDEAGMLGPDNPWGIVGVEVPSYQLGLLEDGTLAFGEYERAALATVECMRDQGVWVSEVEYDAPFFTYVFGGGEDPEAMDLAQGVYDECYGMYQSVVDAAWAVQSAPSEEEQQLEYDRIGECLRSKGFEIDEHPSYDQITSVMNLYGAPALECW